MRPAALALAAACIAACSSPVAVERPATFTNPVVRPVAADPTVIRADDGRYYLYATQDNWADGTDDHVVPTFVSDDLVTWTFAGDAFPESPAWKPEAFVWAPDVSREGAGYALYYSSSVWDDPNPCIGRATAPGPLGPWADLGRPVFCSDDIGVPGSIDPFVWADGDGRRTVVWGSFHGIYAVALSADGTRPEGEKVQLADDRFEAAYVHRRGDDYYLFVSSGSCCEGAESTYEVWVGRSDALLGPYVGRDGRPLLSGGGERVLAENAAWVGPGHTEVVTDAAGADWLLYHAIPRADPFLADGTNRRPALLDRIEWRDGWPHVNGTAGPSTAPQPAPAAR